MLWAIALPLTILVVTIPFLYPIRRVTLSRLWSKRFHVNPKVTWKPPNGLQDEGIELSNYPMPQMRQTWIRSMV
jgi:hypothetical protein